MKSQLMQKMRISTKQYYHALTFEHRKSSNNFKPFSEKKFYLGTEISIHRFLVNENRNYLPSNYVCTPITTRNSCWIRSNLNGNVYEWFNTVVFFHGGWFRLVCIFINSGTLYENSTSRLYSHFPRLHWYHSHVLPWFPFEAELPLSV